MSEENLTKALEKIARASGPHPKASTNTVAHWKGVVDSLKDEALKALGKKK